jgi:hypothetical protein
MRRPSVMAARNYGHECGMIGTVDGHSAEAVMTNSDQGVPVLEAMAAAITNSSSWQIA